MTFAPRFIYTHRMVRDLGTIELARGVIKLLPLPPDQAFFLRHKARFRSMMSSTAIEGNTLSDEESIRAIMRPDASAADMQQERRNYWRALEWIEKQVDVRRSITEKFIRELHCIIDVRTVGRRPQESPYRKDECPVIDKSTRLIDYAPPRPKDVPPLMADLVAWLRSKDAAGLPVEVRAGILAHRFVSIHPFPDGNGRTARALATAELWLGGYDMRGFLSLEEFYEVDRARYYRSLQMNYPVDFYDGRNDPDHTEWLEYFISTMAAAADHLRRTAEGMNIPGGTITTPWDNLNRQQQQLLNWILMKVLADEPEPNQVRPGEVVEWYCVSGNTAREWLTAWVSDGLVEPVAPGAQRIRSYRLRAPWFTLVENAARRARDNAS
jgi:Fic family protein